MLYAAVIGSGETCFEPALILYSSGGKDFNELALNIEECSKKYPEISSSVTGIKRDLPVYSSIFQMISEENKEFSKIFSIEPDKERYKTQIKTSECFPEIKDKIEVLNAAIPTHKSYPNEEIREAGENFVRGYSEKLDLVMEKWTVLGIGESLGEVTKKDIYEFFTNLTKLLKPNGILLFAEPIYELFGKSYEKELEEKVKEFLNPFKLYAKKIEVPKKNWVVVKAKKIKL